MVLECCPVTAEVLGSSPCTTAKTITDKVCHNFIRPITKTVVKTLWDIRSVRIAG